MSDWFLFISITILIIVIILFIRNELNHFSFSKKMNDIEVMAEKRINEIDSRVIPRDEITEIVKDITTNQENNARLLARVEGSIDAIKSAILDMKK